ncbi:putative DNA-binding/iron metalloprotein/AP endonuclease Gcp [Helicobacter bizzozeronii]|uniref:tRNA (adenosine(37)-N6)-threonylcarbamoyltransferase complex transferase subunit TsaD n=1 Tax=Helicobacter bizzozeronii TaxID=56877 RepID=UPI00244D80A4|nr:tRNA (adenosine(37)-N6)-threonylcarbamoyltransferase complex transferase subunit TsaD [Helicobacter bizzozeronii]GMB93313.1 putative DNA-binding/iron metalloprotein/AP endonuclease Gcp [Helicobacter bizzozeronii]
MLLSIESSCDDSSLALTNLEAKLLWHVKMSQENDHSPYGGVVPELASRLHAKNLPDLLKQAQDFLQLQGHSLSALKAIGVTTRPGLSITLLEGLMMAKALSLSLKIPLISIDHLKGHIYSLFINQQALFPISTLLISGGHTLIIESFSHTHMQIVAQSLDDSLGESFDKVAKMLGLGYPGGPVVERYAQECPPGLELDFPLPLKASKALAFSFSGLKNAVRLAILSEQEKTPKLAEEFKARVCAGFQKVACAHLLKVLKHYFQKQRIQNFGLVGGASANCYLREKIQALCGQFGMALHLAPLEFCTDNAAMIGRLAVQSYQMQEFSPLESLDITTQTTLPVVCLS